jgi:MFS family permease
MTGRAAAARYLVGAIPSRVVTNGVSVALALVAAVRLDDVAVAGVLIALLNAPSVVAAPVIGAVMDAVRAPKRLMLAGAAVIAAALALTAFVGTVPIALVSVALVLAGCAVPIFIGGLSAWVDEAMPGDHARGFAVDALSYNIAGIAGPGIVAAISALLGPTGALLVLAALMLVGGLLLQLLPITGRGGSLHPRALLDGIRTASSYMIRHGPLARVAAAGTIVILGAGAMPLLVVLLAVHRGLPESAGGLLLTAFAIGGIAGALACTTRPVTRWIDRFPAARVMAAGFAATGLLTIVAALSGSFALTAVVLGIAGLFDAPGVAAMQRLRLEESPPAVRGQVFVVAAGLRVGAGALAAVLAGALSGLDPVLLMALSGLPWLAAYPILLAGRRLPLLRPAG